MEFFLAGKTVLLTRPRRQAEESRSLFESAGATVLVQPAFDVIPAVCISAEELAPQRLAEYQRIIFSSANGVIFFLEALQKADQQDGGDRLRTVRAIPIAAVGPGTAAELERYKFRADIVPKLHSAEGMAEALAEEARSGYRFLSIRGDRGRAALKNSLTAQGGFFHELSVYQTKEIKKPDEEIVRHLRSEKIDFTIITSSATGTGIVRLLEELLKKTIIVSISPLTSSALTGLGYPPTIEAEEASMPGILAAVKDFTLQSSRSDSD